MKKFNFKKINFKDKRFIFPLILFVIVLLIGWTVFDAINSMPQTEKAPEAASSNEPMDIPLGQEREIDNKIDALAKRHGDKQDYSAILAMNDFTLINPDSSLYTEDEIRMIDSLTKANKQANADMSSKNKEIQEANQSFDQHIRQLGEININEQRHRSSDAMPYVSSSFDKEENNNNTMNEIMMYQKFLRGEEILTPEEERAKAEESIRQEERKKVLEEINARKTTTVEKLQRGYKNPNPAFNTVSNSSSEEDTGMIKAMVARSTTVEAGSRIELKLIEDAQVSGNKIKSGTILYGTVQSFSEQRILIRVNSILYKGNLIKVEMKVFDIDGIEGIFVPKSSFREAVKTASSQALQGGNNITITTEAQTLQGAAIQALQGAYQSTTQAISKNISKNKATIKYNTTVLLISNK